MIKRGKKYKKSASQVEKGIVVPIKEGLQKIKDLASAAFDESIDVDIVLGIDPSKGEQVVRGSVLLPHGRGKKARVIVFAKDDYVDQARNAGADYVGDQDLVEKIKGGWLDFDYAVSTPEMMPSLGVLAKILGPRGLLPNKKLGTVTHDIERVVTDLKKGRAFFKNDKQGGVHFSIGRVSFDVDKLYDNAVAFVRALLAAKPPAARGKFLGSISLSSTMGVGVRVDPNELFV